MYPTREDTWYALRDCDRQVRDRAIAIADSLLDEGYEDSIAFSIALIQARRRAEHPADVTRENNLHVIPHPRGHAVRYPQPGATSFVFPTREEACEFAFDIAERDGTLVMIHDSSGQIEDQIRFDRLPLS